MGTSERTSASSLFIKWGGGGGGDGAGAKKGVGHSFYAVLNDHVLAKVEELINDCFFKNS